jgi:hypothetical protein
VKRWRWLKAMPLSYNGAMRLTRPGTLAQHWQLKTLGLSVQWRLHWGRLKHHQLTSSLTLWLEWCLGLASLWGADINVADYM